MPTSASPAAPISPARCSARCSSAGSPTGSGARSCSSSRSPSISLATAATAFSWNLWSFLLFRFLTGAGIGGEYAAINSTIQELIPARVRGWTDSSINGSFWVGAALGAVGVDRAARSGACSVPTSAGALAFLIGAVLGAGHLLHAAVAAGKPALADDARPRRTRRRRSSPASRRGCAREGHALRRGAVPRMRLRTRSAHAARARSSHTLFARAPPAHAGRRSR